MAFSRNSPGGYQEPYRPSFGGFRFFPPVIKNLLVLNVAVFFLQMFMESGMRIGPMLLGEWFIGTFGLMPIGMGFRVWQLVTYMFMHANFQHIFFNMLALWMFGMEVENLWGSRKFLIFYFACGIGAGLANLFVAPLFTEVTGPTIGASGGVYGVLVAFAMLFPNRMIFIFPLPLPVKAKYLVSFYILIEIWSGFGSSGGSIAHMAHLGGAFIGALWVILDSRGLIDRLMAGSRTHTHISSTGPSVWKDEARDATFYDINTPPKPPAPPPDPHQEVIDRILDKIGKSGYENLTDEEKRILFEESKKLH